MKNFWLFANWLIKRIDTIVTIYSSFKTQELFSLSYFLAVLLKISHSLAWPLLFILTIRKFDNVCICIDSEERLIFLRDHRPPVVALDSKFEVLSPKWFVILPIQYDEIFVRTCHSKSPKNSHWVITCLEDARNCSRFNPVGDIDYLPGPIACSIKSFNGLTHQSPTIQTSHLGFDESTENIDILFLKTKWTMATSPSVHHWQISPSFFG